MDVVNVLPQPSEKVFPTFQQGKDWSQFNQSHDFCRNAHHHRAHEKAAAILGECRGIITDKNICEGAAWSKEGGLWGRNRCRNLVQSRPSSVSLNVRQPATSLRVSKRRRSFLC